MNRRSLLKGLAISALVPRIVYSSTPVNPDVVIVGAGAAGLSAAKTLAGKGRTFVVLEAMGRIGGRCYTDNSVFGVPYDMGAHWMHQRHINPLVDYAKDNGFDVYPANEGFEFYVGDRGATAEEIDEANRSYNRVEGYVSSAGRSGRDVSPAEMIPQDFWNNPWAHSMAASIANHDMGKDIDQFSCKDWWNSSGGEDWFCQQGYGSVLGHYGREVPVQLSTSVSEIDWSGNGVRVVTNNGEIKASAVLVTVSTGVLAADNIKFTPTLSVEKQRSFNDISMGVYNHVALQFSEDIFGYGGDTYIINQFNSDQSIGFVSNISNSNLTFGFVGGRFATDLENAGVDAAIDYGMSEVKRMLGAQVEKKFLKGFYTRWGMNPYTLGSYASAKPGKYPMRKVLRESVAGKVFFAGEACHKNQWATVAGAYKSGIEVAKEIVKEI